jgi:hypothetical protein
MSKFVNVGERCEIYAKEREALIDKIIDDALKLPLLAATAVGIEKNSDDPDFAEDVEDRLICRWRGAVLRAKEQENEQLL